MRLTLGPLQYFWPRDRVLEFYRVAATWPVDVIYLGETVCSKRRELATRDWIALAHEIADSGREVVLSSLALLEAESELAALRHQDARAALRHAVDHPAQGRGEQSRHRLHGELKHAIAAQFGQLAEELRLPLVVCSDAARKAVDAALEHAGLV